MNKKMTLKEYRSVTADMIKSMSKEDFLVYMDMSTRMCNTSYRKTAEFWFDKKGRMHYKLTLKDNDKERLGCYLEYIGRPDVLVKCNGTLKEQLEWIEEDVVANTCYFADDFWNFYSGGFRLEYVPNDVKTVFDIQYAQKYGINYYNVIKQRDDDFNAINNFIEGANADTNDMRLERISLLRRFYNYEEVWEWIKAKENELKQTNKRKQTKAK